MKKPWKKPPLYSIWSAMKDRCTNTKRPAYKKYGGRGIRVCAQWNDFATFSADILGELGERPIGMTLDRKDNAGNYEPGNVRWATSREQAQNTRRNRLIEFRGETLCLTEWARRLGLTQATLDTRLIAGWTIERALTTVPIRVGKG